MSCREVYTLMHKYLDGEADSAEKSALHQHVEQCMPCKDRFIQLQKTVALVQSASHVYAPEDFAAKLIQKLPPNKSSAHWKRWMKNHPFVVAASLFMLLMSGSLFSLWNEDGRQLQVTASQPEQLQVDEERQMVIVPVGSVITGDIVVRYGDINILGEVQGSVVAIKGDVLLASTATVSGRTEEIDQILEWIWYYIKKAVFSLAVR